MKTLIILLALATTALAQVPAEKQGSRTYLFTWDSNPEDIVTGYMLKFIFPNGTEESTVATVGEVEGRQTGELRIPNCPDTAFNAQLYALQTDPISGKLINISPPSDLIVIPPALNAPKGLKIEVVVTVEVVIP